MARKKMGFIPTSPVEDTRPLGSVSWADVNMNVMTPMVHTFNPPEFYSERATGEGAVRGGPRYNSPAALTWHEHDQRRVRNRRKGYEED